MDPTPAFWTRPPPGADLPYPLKLTGVAAGYALLAQLALAFFSADGFIGVFWPADGFALAVLLVGGRRFVWGVFAGAFLSDMLAGTPALTCLGTASGTTAGVLLGHWLLTRDSHFDLNLTTLGDYGRLIVKAAIPASTVSALIGVASLTMGGVIDMTTVRSNMLYWCLGDALGVLLITPLVLIWRQRPDQLIDKRRWFEAALLLSLTLLVAEVVFHAWLPWVLPEFSRKGYWVIPLAFWAAVRLGRHGVIAVLCIVATLAMHSIHENVGFFASPQTQARLLDGWFFVAISSLLIMFLAMYLEGLRRAEADLRIAAIAFECQEGMVVTDPNHVILRVNQSFCRIMGYSSEEVIGKSTSLMRSDRHPPSFYEAIWQTSKRTGTSAHEVWHRRKNGEVFPQWLTSTAVRDVNGEITNYVVTHTDITTEKEQEARRQAAEASHRDALVREVHHRIKNNLQGITGLLRQTAHEHPEVEEILNQAIAQVRSIAVIHGLQGRADVSRVRLCELTNAIAQDIASLWQAPIHVDIPSIWNPGVIAENEAVPVALVLNELIINAVKHGGKANGLIDITLRKGRQPESIQVSVTNGGQWRTNTDRPGTESHAGLKLIDTLLPRMGAHLENEKLHNRVVTRLELEPPVITLENSI